ncbi:MAG: hypothetical protein Kow0063_42210 [Anaerolineae bacterium]
MRVRQLAHSVAQMPGDPAPGKELSRLLTAAVINRDFCNLLLANPAMALATGYNGEPFDLATDEQELVFSIRATTLADFARQLTRNGNGNGNGNGYTPRFNGNRNGHKNGHNNRFQKRYMGDASD